MKIIFVCTGNTCRSPMAELIFNKLCREKELDFSAQSAGLCTIDGLPISENSAKALGEIGIESQFFRSTDITELDLDEFYKIYAMTDEHLYVLSQMDVDEDRAELICKTGISDPYGMGLGVYRLCRDEIYNSIKEITEGICK